MKIGLLTEEAATYERMFDEAQFGTPDGSRDKDIGVPEEKRPVEVQRPGIREAARPSATGGQRATQEQKSKGKESVAEDDFQKATLQVMLGLVQGMQELQKRVLEVERGEDGGEAEWVRGGSMALPMLPEWSSLGAHSIGRQSLNRVHLENGRRPMGASKKEATERERARERDNLKGATLKRLSVDE